VLSALTVMTFSAPLPVIPAKVAEEGPQSCPVIRSRLPVLLEAESIRLNEHIHTHDQVV
jgi:hypothetical protein